MNKTISLFIELRKRLLTTAIFFCLLFGLFFFLSPQVFHWYMLPLVHNLPHQDHLIATQITTPLLTPLYISSHLALLFTVPYGLFHLWRFSSPALYQHEKRTVQITIILSMLLFILGAIFCYFFILPFMFHCIIQSMPSNVLFLPDISSASHFITWMMLIFGLSFQVPLICVIAVQVNLIQLKQLIAIRPYWIVTAFTLGMLLTPPDVISQILLALPLWGLYELGIGLSRILIKTQ